MREGLNVAVVDFNREFSVEIRVRSSQKSTSNILGDILNRCPHNVQEQYPHWAVQIVATLVAPGISPRVMNIASSAMFVA